MPVYQHKCPECGYVAEEVAPIDSGPSGLICLVCAAQRGKHIWMRRLWQATAVIFRGSGWASKS